MAGWSSWESRVWVMSAPESRSGTCEYFQAKGEKSSKHAGSLPHLPKRKDLLYVVFKRPIF